MMLKKINTAAQGSSMLLMLMFLLLFLFFIIPTYGAALGNLVGIALEPLIGFNRASPILTVFLAGIIVVTMSSLLTNFFTDWKKMAESQEIGRAYQKEITEARKTGNTNRVQKLMKMQPQIMKRQTEASGGMMKPMVFLMIFIFPIFMWLRAYLGSMSYYYFTVPWADRISLFDTTLPGGAWLWVYLVFSMIIGQIIRQALKLVSFSDWWKDIKGKIKPSV
jgi:uncharacterized membrane protein (DUF106 family)